MALVPGENITAVVSYNGSALTIGDDVLWRLGTDGDQVFVNSSAGIATDVEVTNLIVGTSVHPAAAANSLIISNITASGDILMLANRGGNSEYYLLVDASAGTLSLNAPAGTISFFANSAGGIIKAGGGGVHSNNFGTIPTTAGEWYVQGRLWVNDTANANMANGITINQGANDDQILALKSSDVAHGMTAAAETDTYAAMQKTHATVGGLFLRSFGGSSTVASLGLDANNSAAADTTKTTAAVGVVTVYAGLANGTGRQAVGADGNLFVVTNFGTARHIMDAEGTYHGDEVTATFDGYDDLGLVAMVEHTLTNPDAFMDPARRKMLEDSGLVGRDSWHVENGQLRAMINHTRRAQLTYGAVQALGRAMFVVCDELGITDRVRERLGKNAGLLPV